MRSFLLAGKLAVVFAVLLGGMLLGIVYLFAHVAGHELMEVLLRVNAYDGVETARAIEAMLDDVALNSPEVRARLATDSRGRKLDMRIEPWTHRAATRARPDHRHPAHVEVAGRRCEVVSWSWFRVAVPVLQGGEPVARLVVGSAKQASTFHVAFHHGLVRIALIGLIAIVGLTVYLTMPLRRMSRSMDRVAVGELDHRLKVRGGDEMAAMGKSFNAMADRIESMVTGQKELLAGVSHELRSPLGRMKMLLTLLREQGGTGGAPLPRLDELEVEVDAIDHLVGELLATSRLDLEAADLPLEALDLAPLVEEAWSRIVTAPDAARPRLVLRLADDACQAQANLPLLRRMVKNLLENAARYAPDSTVTVSSRRQGDRLAVTVADDGPGVDPDLLERLFEPFVRGDPARQHADRAVGLGLMIVRRAAEAHGGTVRAEAAQPTGLAVTFDLPAPE